MAGSELLIPTLLLPFGVGIKLSGSLSRAVSLPMMPVGFARYSRRDRRQLCHQPLNRSGMAEPVRAPHAAA